MIKNLILSLLFSFFFSHIGFSQKPAVVTPEMILVEGGTFIMGNDSANEDERPAHKVKLKSFYLGKYEITHREFKNFIESSGYVTDAEQPDSIRLKNGWPARVGRTGTWNYYANGIPVSTIDSLYPVGNISWNDATAYCVWLTKETGQAFRLPTEAEWEFAARGGIKSKGYAYSGGDKLNDVAWHLGNSRNKPRAVGLKTPNELGLHDMSGNAREWCADWYGESYYSNSPQNNPAGPDTGTHRVMRGGFWGSFESHMRISKRSHEFPFHNALNAGFRIAREAD